MSPVMWLLSYPYETEWTKVQTNCYSETVVGAGTETRTFASVARDTRIGKLGTTLIATSNRCTPILTTITLAFCIIIAFKISDLA
jgi:hypothetical protein